MPVCVAGVKDEVHTASTETCHTSADKQGSQLVKDPRTLRKVGKESRAVFDFTLPPAVPCPCSEILSRVTMPNPSTFQDKKRRILEDLATPSEEYTDLSPKGSVDEGVRELCDEINALEGYVTTSSCAGRIAVYMNGSGKDRSEDGRSGRTEREAGKGGKGGGEWLFVTHDAFKTDEVSGDGEVFKSFGIEYAAPSVPTSAAHCRLVYLKFEPMVSSRVIRSCSILFFPHVLLFRFSTSLRPQLSMHRPPTPLPTTPASVRAAFGASLVLIRRHTWQSGHKAWPWKAWSLTSTRMGPSSPWSRSSTSDLCSRLRTRGLPAMRNAKNVSGTHS